MTLPFTQQQSMFAAGKSGHQTGGFPQENTHRKRILHFVSLMWLHPVLTTLVLLSLILWILCSEGPGPCNDTLFLQRAGCAV